MKDWNYRLIGGVAAVLLVAAVLVPVLLDRVDEDTPRASARPTVSVVRQLPTIPPPTAPAPTRTSTAEAPATQAPPSASEPGRRSPDSLGEIEFPRTAPPLPALDVPPAVLAYSLDCDDETRPCMSWRLLDWKGRHWTLPEGTAVSVSPNGERIAYFQPDGRFVVRDLASGAVDAPVQVPPQALRVQDAHVTWSPNGRWLTLDYQTRPLQNGEPRRAILVDTTTMRFRRLDLACCVSGLHPAADWLLTYDLYGEKPSAFQLIDPATLRTVRSIDPVELYEQRWAKERTAYPLSPDGRRFVIFLWDREAGTHGLGLVDTATGKASQLRLRDEGVAWGEVLGWPDGITVAIATEDIGQVLTYDVQDRELRAAYTFSESPDQLSVATTLVRAQ